MNLKTLGLAALLTGAVTLGCATYTDTLADDDTVLDDDDSAVNSSLEVLAVDDPIVNIEEVIDCEAVTAGLSEGFYVGDLAPDFSLYNKNMDLITLSNYHEDVRLLVLGFGNCGSCQREAKDLEDIYDQYSNKGFMIFEILYWGYDSAPTDVEFLEEWEQDWCNGPIDYHILMDNDDVTYPYVECSAPSFPVNVIVGRCGVIHGVINGYGENTFDEFYGAIDAAFDFDYSP